MIVNQCLNCIGRILSNHDLSSFFLVIILYFEFCAGEIFLAKSLGGCIALF